MVQIVLLMVKEKREREKWGGKGESERKRKGRMVFGFDETTGIGLSQAYHKNWSLCWTG